MEAAVYTNAASVPAKPLRRVGSWTLGVVLIACGVCLLAHYFWPKFDYVMAAKLSPLVLIALGVEVLICAARPEKRKYDFFSIFMCLVLMGCALCVSAIPVVWDYIGPDRYESEAAMNHQLEQQLYQQLKGGDVKALNVQMSLSSSQIGEVTLEELNGVEQIWLVAELTGPYTEKEAFVVQCRAVVDAAQALPVQVDEITVFWSAEEPNADMVRYASLFLASPYQMDWDAAAMAANLTWEEPENVLTMEDTADAG